MHGLALPPKPARKVTTCSNCQRPGHTRPRCPELVQASTLGCSSSSSDSLKRVAAVAAGPSKKKTSATGSITVEDACSDDETDSNQSHFDSEEEGPVDCLDLPEQYDGGDADNSEEEEEAPSAADPASSSSAVPASIADALVWCNLNMVSLNSHDLRSVPAAAALPVGQVPQAVGLVEPITNLLPVFKGRHPGTLVNKTPGAPLVFTPADFFMLMWDTVMLGSFLRVLDGQQACTLHLNYLLQDI
jgi:hypothetical protein